MKKLLCALLALALAFTLALPAFADTPEFTITADKRMVATGESITLTAVNAPQAQAGQTVQYRWYFNYSPTAASSEIGHALIGTTTDAVIQAQAPGRDVVWPTYTKPFTQQFTTRYWCVVDISDASGPVASYTSSKIEVMGYYGLGDSFAVPYVYFGYILAYMLVPMFIFYDLTSIPISIACLFGIFWSPFVLLANSVKAKLVNG